MARFLDLLRDNSSVGGRAVTSGLILVLAALVGAFIGRLVTRRTDDIFNRYYLRKVAHYAAAFAATVSLALLWRPFAGNIGLVLGLATAGLAFAMQEVIGALAGWVNVLSGRIYRIGDRIEVGGVRGDVIDIAPLRTKLMEIGASSDDPSVWVRGRQFTGRVVAVSNKKTFTEPVFNYSTGFEFLWDELTVVVSHRGQSWERASQILGEEIERVSNTAAATEAAEDLVRHFPVRRADVEPRVFARVTDNYVELSARFAVPLREAREMKDALTRSVLRRFQSEHIDIASATMDITLRPAQDSAESSREPA